MLRLIMSQFVLLAMGGLALAQSQVEVGLVGPFSGADALYGQQFQAGMQLYLDTIKGKVGGTSLEIVVRDDGAQPERAKQLSQELIVNRRVRFLAGYETTPEALSVAPLITETKTPTVILNAATGSITRQSPYYVRVSHTQWQGAYTIAQWAAKNGIKRAFVLVADYAPGNDARAAFKAGFTKEGGEVVGEIAYPLSTTDFGPFLQRIKNAKPDAIYAFTPVGPLTISLMNTYAQLGLKEAGIKFIGTGETDEMILPQIGDAAIGVVTAYHYSSSLDTPQNKAFVAAMKKKYGADVPITFAAVAGYVGMNAIADTVAKLGANFSGDQAMQVLKGWKSDSPKGPVQIDPNERDIVQNIYIRRVEKLPNGTLANVVFETVPAVLDPWKQFNRSN